MGGSIKLCLQTSRVSSASLGQTDRQTVAPPPTPPPLYSPPVPTVPPGNVHAEATNSTTIRFTWNAPSPQFINGINQGYKVREVSPGPGRKPARRTRAGDERSWRVQEGIPAVSEITGSGQAEDMYVIKAEGLGLSPSPRPGPGEYRP